MNRSNRRRLPGRSEYHLAPASLALLSMLVLAAGCGVKNDAAAIDSPASGGVLDGAKEQLKTESMGSLAAFKDLQGAIKLSK